MRIARRLVVVLALGLAVALTSAPPGDAFALTARERAWRETQALCPALRDVDFKRLGDDDGAWRDQARALLRATDRPELGDADMVIRFHAPPGFGGEVSTWTTARRVNGRWLFRREDRPLPPPSPEPPQPFVIDMRAQRSRATIISREGPLEAARAAAIEAALADPCFAREPDAAPAALPLRHGGDDICLDGAPFFLQIESAAGVRTFAHSCTTRWRAGEIMRALESAQGEPGQTTVMRGLTPLVLVDAQNRDVAAADAPPPLTLRLEGEYAGRALSFSINDVEVYEGEREPNAVWTIYPPLGAGPTTLRFNIAPCAAPLTAVLAEGTSIVTVHGCRLRLAGG